jgi:hypothetical protein
VYQLLSLEVSISTQIHPPAATYEGVMGMAT